MCDSRDYALGETLSQRKCKVFHAIHYAKKLLNGMQFNYAMTGKEFLAIVSALEKLRSYLIGSIIVIYINQAFIKCLKNKHCCSGSWLH